MDPLLASPDRYSTLARAVAVINATIDGGDDPLGSIRQALSRFAAEDEVYPDAALAVIAAATASIEAVFDTSDLGTASLRLNAILAETSSAPRLSNHGGGRWHLHVNREPFDWASWFLSASALAMATALSEQGRIAWGRCAREGCGRVFSGTGSGAPQTYCSNRCGSRVRMARRRASGISHV